MQYHGVMWLSCILLMNTCVPVEMGDISRRVCVCVCVDSCQMTTDMLYENVYYKRSHVMPTEITWSRGYLHF